ncbi:hypothetical protein ACBY01_07935 [Sphingomonas sp. ac-8]|uniref:hypothetical protein n=1 Tax=Sphingomonas sp. ac-8 TaxID=3242977 RepID=UPI003A7FEC25
MAKWMLMAVIGLGAPVLGLSAPAVAQNAAQNGVLVIYGNDKCPTNSSGEEIVVCVRRGEEERFRIPKELRTTEVSPDQQSWAVRQQSALEAGQTGVGSCGVVGAASQSGCFVQEANRWRAERRARQAEAEASVP